MCDFYLSLYQAMSSRFKKMIIVVEICWCVDEQKKKIDYWLDVEDSREKIDNWLSFKQTHWLTSSKEAKRSTIEILIEFSFLITIDWLTSKTKRSTIDWDVVQADSLTNWLRRRFAIESFRWFEDALCKFHSTHENVMLHDLSTREFHTLRILF